MAEAFKYRSEDVLNSRGEVVDTALFRIYRDKDGNWQDWSKAEFRGTGDNYMGRRRGRESKQTTKAHSGGEDRREVGRVRRSARGAAGRGASRNPSMGTQIRRDNRELQYFRGATKRASRGGKNAR